MEKIIGIMGALICNENMGCVALSYSLLLLLEKIRKECGFKFRYIIFEDDFDIEKYNKLAQCIHTSEKNLYQTPIADFNNNNWKVIAKNLFKRAKMKQMIKKCDVVIDITRGDSFTDLYGNARFLRLTKIKEIVEDLGIPLILAPQTYGPFQKEGNKRYARKIIEAANFVMSRDKASAVYIDNFCNKEVFVTTDLAFGLPYIKSDKERQGLIKVGINPSGLLSTKKSEGTNLNNELSVDYDKYINQLLDYLENSGNYEIHLIPHVGQDAVQFFKNGRENVIAHEAFETPIEAKNCISQMDIFIGSRMHATIGALSSGVVTIPVAYSRKFSGLFESIGYMHTIDICTMNNNSALQKTIYKIEHYKDIEVDVSAARKEIDRQYNLLYQTMKAKIVDIFDGERT